MKVLVIRTTKKGGAGIAASRFAEWLRFYGHTVHVFGEESLNSRGKVFQKVDKRLNKLARLILPDSSIKGLLNLTLIGNKRDLKRFLQRDAYDIIFVHWFHAGLFTFNQITKLNRSSRLVLFAHDQNLIASGYGYNIKRSLGYSLLHEMIVSVVSVYRTKKMRSSNFEIWVPSNWLMMEFLYKGFSEDRVKLFRNYGPLYLPVISHDRDIDVVFIADNLNDFRKGATITMDLIEKFNPKLNVATIGKKLPQLNNTRQFGSLDSEEVLRVLGRSKILVITSLLDNYPNVIGEALAIGTHVICIMNSGFTEIALNHPTVRCYTLSNRTQINNDIDKIIENFKPAFDSSYFNFNDVI